MNYLKLHCSFSLETITHSSAGAAHDNKRVHCDTFLSRFSTTTFRFIQLIFATSKYDNSPQGAIVGFTRFNGKPLTFSSSTTTDGMAS